MTTTLVKSKKMILKTIAEEDSETDHSITTSDYKNLLKKVHNDLKLMKIGKQSKKSFWIAPRKLKTIIKEINAMKEGRYILKN